MKKILTVALCAVAVLVLVYVAYGQSREDMAKLDESKRHIQLLGKVREAIRIIEEERKPPERVKVLKFIDVSDFVTRVPQFAGPDVRVFDPEQARAALSGASGAITWGDDEDSDDMGEPFGPEELIELVKARTGEDKWPEAAGGFGTIEQHRGKLIVCNTPEVIREVEQLLSEIRANAPALVSSSIYLLSAEDEYLRKVRAGNSPVITPEAVRKIISDSRTGEEVKLVRASYLTAYSSQSAYVFSGTAHTYIGDMNSSAAKGQAAMCIFDPVVNICREGFVVNLRAQYNRQTKQINLVAAVNLCKLTSIEEHAAIGGADEKLKSCKLEAPRVDLQAVSGSADVPEGYGLLIGGSKMKTAQTEQKSFVVLVVPEVLK